MISHLQKAIENGQLDQVEIYAYRVNDSVFVWKNISKAKIEKNGYTKYCINDSLNDLPNEEKNIIKVFKKYKNRKSIIVVHSKEFEEFSKEKKHMPPILDDMAQVVGMSLKFTEKNKDYSKLLKWRNCVLTEEGALFAAGRTAEESIVIALIAEKSVKCYLESKKIKGAKKINFLRCFLMYTLYKSKYSKENIKRQRERTNV